MKRRDLADSGYHPFAACYYKDANETLLGTTAQLPRVLTCSACGRGAMIKQGRAPPSPVRTREQQAPVRDQLARAVGLAVPVPAISASTSDSVGVALYGGQCCSTSASALRAHGVDQRGGRGRLIEGLFASGVIGFEADAVLSHR